MSRIQGTILGLVALATFISSGEAHAQRVRIGIGIGGPVGIGIGTGPVYGGYYGPGYYGPRYGYGPYGYGPPPIVVAPPPVYAPSPIYVPQPVYVQPQPVYAPQQQPQTLSGPTPISDGGEILLLNATMNVSDVHYSLNGQRFTMRPGTQHRFKNDRTWTIQFESGPGQLTKYQLNSGQYKFKPSGAGVGLFQTQDTHEFASSLRSAASAPVPNPPEAPTPAPDLEATVIPSRPPLKTTR